MCGAYRYHTAILKPAQSHRDRSAHVINKCVMKLNELLHAALQHCGSSDKKYFALNGDMLRKDNLPNVWTLSLEQQSRHCSQLGCPSFVIALRGSTPYSREHEISTAVGATALADPGFKWSCGGGGGGEEGLFISSGERKGV